MTQELGCYTVQDVQALAQAAYTCGTADFALDLRRAALLVIDLQDEFVRPGWSPFWVPAATEMLPLVAQVLAAARRAGRPVVHTAFAATHGYLDRPASGAKMPNRYPQLTVDGLFVAAHFAGEVEPLPGETVLLKPSYGAFYDTPLDTILRNLGCDTVVISGTLTNLCCGATARQAYERGYRVVFGRDVTASNDAVLHAAELQTLRYGFARLADAQELIRAFAEVQA